MLSKSYTGKGPKTDEQTRSAEEGITNQNNKWAVNPLFVLNKAGNLVLNTN